jgi:hypothetical protein
MRRKGDQLKAIFAANHRHGACRCGKRPEPGFARCEACRKAESVACKERYRLRRVAGLCWSCGGPPGDGRTLCMRCAENRSNQQKKRVIEKRANYQRRLANGVCVYCQQAPRVENRRGCRPCMDRQNERQRKARAAR